MTLNDEIHDAVDTLEAIRFLTHGVEGEPAETISMARAQLPDLNRPGRLELRALLRRNLREVRQHYGAKAPNSKYLEMLNEARRYPGYAYLPKLFIDRELFSHYDRVFPRWPHIPSHALVVFDGQTLCPTNGLYVPEVVLLGDALQMLERARGLHKGIVDFRRRDVADQRLLQTYLRATATAAFQTLEAYLNGIAYDCFQEHHDTLEVEEHDLLAEWNSKKRRRAFVTFERKMREYPSVASKAIGRTFDASDLECLEFIVEVGKSLRDAITHPSPFIDPRTGQTEKTFWMVGGLGGYAACRRPSAADQH